jgi:hypothetical protein
LAKPAPFGEAYFNDTFKLIERVNRESKAEYEIEVVDGTHHFHMMKAQETAVLLLRFLEKLKKISK